VFLNFEIQTTNKSLISTNTRTLRSDMNQYRDIYVFAGCGCQKC